MHSLQSWTAVTADQLHCSPSSTGGGLTAVTAKLDCSHCRSTSLQPKFNWGRGSDCTHCKVGLQSLQIKFTAAQVQLGGGGVQLHSLQSWTAVTADQLHCSPSSTRGGGLTAVTADQLHCSPSSTEGGSDCSHCRSTSLQPKFN